MRYVHNFGNLYLGNKMVGIPYFNAPWFDSEAEALRKYSGIRDVFNPAEADRRMGFEPMKCPNGTAEEAQAHGFERRRALGADWGWIAAFSDGMLAGPDWESSTGTISEIAAHQALGLPVWESEQFLCHMKADTVDYLLTRHAQIPDFRSFIHDYGVWH